MARKSVFALLFCFVDGSGGLLKAQHLRLGVAAGTGVTADYSNYYAPGNAITWPDGTTAPIPPYFARSGGRSLIGGPTVAWEFNDRFSLGTNAIYRRLHLQGAGPTVTWEFPVLAKFRLPRGGVRPFAEFGPSFRTTGNLNTHPSHTGFAAGAGLDWEWRGFRLSPTMRYTRWASDPAWTVRSKQDQVEALFTASHAAAGDRRPLGVRVSAGIAGGLMLVRPLRSSEFRSIGIPTGAVYDTFREYRRMWISGPRVEFAATERLAVLAEANYRQIRYRESASFDVVDLLGVRLQGTASFEGKAAVLWQFPLLVRYSLGGGAVRPFVDAGPSFRLPQDLGGSLSTVGAAAGAGVRFRRHGAGIESGLRFSHWGPARLRNGGTASNHVRRNQLDAVFAVTF